MVNEISRTLYINFRYKLRGGLYMTYLKPEIEILELKETDVITISPGGETDGDDNGVGWG